MRKEDILSLIRLGIGTGTDTELVLGSSGSTSSPYSYKIQGSIDWSALKDFAGKQGLSSIVLDGIERLPDQQRPSKVLLLEWIGETLQGYEYRYEQYCKAIAELAGFYNSHGFKMMVLKGYACSLDWSKPEHRPCGDIDIWLFGKQKEADKVLAYEKGLKVDDGHEHHTVFYWHDFIVENHYDFIDTHHRKSSPQLETIFKKLGQDDSHFVEVYGEKVFLPSPNLHALFLLRHAMQHFVGAELTLRQLLDWAFFVEKHGEEVDWAWLIGVLEDFGMLPAFNIFNAICVDDLGFDVSIFHKVKFSPYLKDRVLNDILSPEFSGGVPTALLPRVLFKYRRWRANGWKNKLCFKESLRSAFWSGVCGHLLKPKSL